MALKIEQQEILDRFDKKHLLILYAGWVSMIGEQFFDKEKTEVDMVDIFIEDYLKPNIESLVDEK